MIKENKRTEETRQQRVYTIQELSHFHDILNKYRKDVTLPTGEVVNILDWETIYYRTGVRNSLGEVIVYERINGDYYVPQTELENKLSQWSFWRTGKEYGNGKKAEYFQTIYEQQATELFDEISVSTSGG